MASNAKKAKLNDEILTNEEQYFAVDLKDGFACLLCDSLIPYINGNEAQNHYFENHGKAHNQYKLNPGRRAEKFHQLKKKFFSLKDSCKIVKSDLRSVQKTAFIITYKLAKNNKSLQDGEVIKKLMLDVIPELMVLCSARINFISAIESLSMTPESTRRRINIIGSNISNQLKKDIKKCDWCSLMIGGYECKTKTPENHSLLVVSIRMVFENMEIKEELLDMIALPKTINGNNIYKALRTAIRGSNLNTEKVASVTIDTSSAFLSEKNVDMFIECCKKDDITFKWTVHKCLLHLAETCLDTVKMDNMIEEARSMITYLTKHGSNKKAFEELITEDKLELAMNFFANLPTIRDSLDNIGVYYRQLDTASWITKLTFYVDMATRVINLIASARGCQQNPCTVVDAIVQFRNELVSWEESFKETLWPDSFPRTQAAMCELELELLFEKCSILIHLKTLIQRIHEDLSHFKRVMEFSTNLRQPLNVSKLDVERCINVLIESGMEISQNTIAEYDLLVKNTKRSSSTLNPDDIWTVIKKDKYPNLVSIYQRNLSIFSTAWMDRAILEYIRNVKEMNEFNINDSTIKDLVRIIASTYSPDYSSIVDTWNANTHK